MKHTKGPWTMIETASLKKGGAKTIMLCNKTPHIHGILYGVSDQDAKLIAAAPELLEALVNITNNLIDTEGDTHPDTGDQYEDVKQALDAIAKAKGEDQ